MIKKSKNKAPSLFRQEVFDARSKDEVGLIVLSSNISFTIISVVAALASLTIIAFLYFGNYTRRITLNGQLLPTSGLIRVTSPQAGAVLEKYVKEGQHVNKGDILYVLSSARIGLSTRELQADIGLQISNRKKSLENEISRNTEAERNELNLLEQRLVFLQNEKQSIQAQIEQQRQRVALVYETYKRYKGLAENNYIAEEQLVQKQIEMSEQNSRLQVLQRDMFNNQRDQSATNREMSETKTKYANLNAQLLRTISSTMQESTELESKRRVVITAPQSGRATLVSAEVGQSINDSFQLVSLVPEQAIFEARLYAPSSAIGFVRKGNRVLLRYHAFPYQKFGLYEGIVTSVSIAPVVSQEFQGYGNNTSKSALMAEPLYTITVIPKLQYVLAYGEKRPLQSGLQLEAEVLQENRKLYEWALEPLFSISGKLKQ